MKYFEFFKPAVVGIALVAAIGFSAWFPGDAKAGSSESGTQTLKEKHHERARILREKSKARARSNLGYENVIPTDEPIYREVDFQALGLQIQRLGKMIQRLADPAGAGMPGVAPSPSLSAGAREAFGPNGPTEKSVRIFMEYRLMITGNPRLKVGPIHDRGKVIRAQVVTHDGSVVEVYDIDKSSGIMTPVRK